jgi:hypothetical protein
VANEHVESDDLRVTTFQVRRFLRSPPVLPELPPQPDPARFFPPAIARAAQLSPQQGHTTLVAAGGDVAAIHTQPGVTVRPDPASAGWFIGPMAAQIAEWTPVLVEFSDGLCCPIAAYPDTTIAVVRDAIGAAAVSYHNPSFDGPAGEPGPTETAIAEMEARALRADAAVDYAVKLRMHKHRDPVLGVISAYLYDSISDTDNVRRMAAFYVEAGQPIPYDVALLALVRGYRLGDDLRVAVPAVPFAKPRSELEGANPFAFAATQATDGRVGGFWPWMRQGWAFLEDPLDIEATLIQPVLGELAKDLKPARFTTFGAQSGALFAQTFKLQKTAA